MNEQKAMKLAVRGKENWVKEGGEGQASNH